VAAFWVVAFCTGCWLFNRLWHHELVGPADETPYYLGIGFLLFVSLPAAIAGLLGQWRWGAFIGLVLFCGFALFVMFSISKYGI